MSFERTPAPSRCPECNSRHMQPYRVVMDTFAGADCCWQCIGCGLILETCIVGKEPRITNTGTRRAVVLPRGLGTFRDRSGVGKRAQKGDPNA